MMTYRGIPVQAAPSMQRRAGEFDIEIGEPFVIAAKDESPGEGHLVTPFLYDLNGVLRLSWSFDRDVLDRALPDRPYGRFSFDGGHSWRTHAELVEERGADASPTRELVPRWTALSSDSHLLGLGDGAVVSFYRCGFESPDRPGYYMVPTWLSQDNGVTWAPMDWTGLPLPGTRGYDPYDPPEPAEGVKQGNFHASPPPFVEVFARAVSPRRLSGISIHPQLVTRDGTIHSFTYGRHPHAPPKGADPADPDAVFAATNWRRYAVRHHTSDDAGRTWLYRGVIIHGAEYEDEIDFHPGDGFTEPAPAAFPDGEWVMALRAGHFRPLYLIRSHDGGESWSDPAQLPIRGIKPQLEVLENGALVLGTGRPDCTVHISNDRGRSWPASEVLYTVGREGPGALHWPHRTPDLYSNSHCNVTMCKTGPNTVLYVHDATRPDPTEGHRWLRKHGHGLIIGRFITVT